MVYEVASSESGDTSVPSLYKRLARIVSRRERNETDRGKIDDEMAEVWQALLDANEKHVTIANASGVHKTYIKKMLDRRAQRAEAQKAS